MLYIRSLHPNSLSMSSSVALHIGEIHALGFSFSSRLSAGAKLGFDGSADLGLVLDPTSFLGWAKLVLSRMSDCSDFRLSEDRRGLDVPLITRVELGLSLDGLSEGGDGGDKEGAKHFVVLFEVCVKMYYKVAAESRGHSF